MFPWNTPTASAASSGETPCSSSAVRHSCSVTGDTASDTIRERTVGKSAVGDVAVKMK